MEMNYINFKSKENTWHDCHFKYKCLFGGNARIKGLSFQEEISHTYT